MEYRFLPKEYIQVEYLQCTGTQYIDTCFKVNNTCGYEIDFQTFDTKDTIEIGVRGSTNTHSRWCLNTSTSRFNLSWNGIPSTAVSLDQSRHVAKMNYFNDRKRWFDSVEDSPITETLNSTAGTYNVCLFGAYWGSSSVSLLCTSSRIYSAKITKANALVRNFIPAKRKSDNVLGMYDVVNDVFYTNQGTGTFIAGNEVKCPIKLPYIRENNTTKPVLCYDANKKLKLIYS